MPLAFQTQHCLFCPSDRFLKPLYARSFRDADVTAALFSARRSKDRFHYAMVRCQSCGLVFSREVLREETLSSLYTESGMTFDHYSAVLKKDYWRALEPHLGALNRNDALEVGCSSGFFLEELLDQGFTGVVGFEPSQDARAKAAPTVASFIRGEFFRDQAVELNRFDLACAFHAFDHLTHPKEAAASLWKTLKPGGLAFIVTHDVEAIQARVLGELSPIIDIEHIYLFSKQTLGRLFQETGFANISVQDLENSYPLTYWLHLMPLPQFLRKPAAGLLRILGVDQWAPRIRAGNIYAIARKPLVA